MIMQECNWFVPSYACSSTHLYCPSLGYDLCSKKPPRKALPHFLPDSIHKRCYICYNLSLSLKTNGFVISTLAWFPSILALAKRFDTFITLYPLAVTVYLVPWEQLHLLLLRAGLDQAFREAHQAKLFYYDGVPANLVEDFLAKK